ncbi:hypothetical protein [Sandaracinus amylolyticus]|uniref:hypothetical protein n=1 Tax=Sandaracinus amylolyticus TaxID=927083 RepID=UPI001F1B3321|nr:hypothetical protein [Sandaracinus amylolyticus]UJR82479.1 Hypothetical protein I5071_45440 [Sandaracinus amylolyticus]
MRTSTVFGLVTLILSAGGCATSGGGSGTLETGKPDQTEPVAFQWNAAPDATHGTIQAELLDGRDFSGEFLQVTTETRATDLDPYWDVWGGPWYGMADDTTFVRHYTGRVIAQLTGPEGQRMRCNFQLADPEAGPQSGGMGECELSTGERVEDATLRGQR